MLGKPSLLKPAVTEAIRFDPTLLTSGGADNGWLPTPVETVQIAYGVDSRVQSLLAVGDAGGTRAARDLAAMEAAWFFGANRSGKAMYDPKTGVTFDGLEADGRINPNSGAESAIHGLLTMLALDAHPAVPCAGDVTHLGRQPRRAPRGRGRGGDGDDREGRHAGVGVDRGVVVERREIPRARRGRDAPRWTWATAPRRSASRRWPGRRRTARRAPAGPRATAAWAR